MFAIVAEVIGVSTKPGQTAFTVTPVPASSAAAARTSPRTPCLLAVYAARYGSPIRAPLDARTTTRPDPSPRMPGTAPPRQRDGAGRVRARKRGPAGAPG